MKKEIDGKYYNICNVVMLPTNSKHTEKGQLCLNSDFLFSARESDNVGGLIPQHLYKISDEEIKKYDWVLFEYDLDKKLGVTLYKNVQNKELCKKIIATTDESLNLPLLSDSFVFDYVEEYKNNKLRKAFENFACDVYNKYYTQDMSFREIAELMSKEWIENNL